MDSSSIDVESLQSCLKHLNKMFFSVSQEKWIYVVNFLNYDNSHVTDRMTRQVEMSSDGTIFIFLNVTTVFSKSCGTFSISFSQILESAFLDGGM